MSKLLENLGNPQNSFKSIHIAGTSGKGSTAYLIAKILHKNGYSVGLHISPHLQSIRERFIVNNKLISESEFAEVVSLIKPQVIATSKSFEIAVTYFEAILAAVFVHFRNKKIEFGVIETGLGGTYDGTNVLNSLISVITRIGFDHTAILGNTITKIASQKAEIIKSSNIVCISQTQLKDAENVIEQVAKSHKTPALLSNRDFNDSTKAGV
ncbi:MAG: Mur ligase family protein [bacterium]|nr:Mur ligase family protein [bacterium]